MRRAGRLAAEVLKYIEPHVEAGVSTNYLNQLCHTFIIEHGAIPAPLGYHGFPKATCISRNEVVCHGIPSEDVLCDGDIVNVDVTVILDGWHGDTSRTFLVGCTPPKAVQLVSVAEEALARGIQAVRPDAHFGDIGAAIQEYVESSGYSVVRAFCGHGIGRVFHDAPEVLHFGQRGSGPRIIEGMCFTIEPMINAGHWDVLILEDEWTAVTRDGSLSAQFEHTIGVTNGGCEIFTKTNE